MSRNRKEPTALAREWYLLDNIVGISLTTGPKGKEIELLRELRIAYPEFPEGRVFAWEAPDFVVDNGRCKVGIEVTEVYAGESRKGSRYAVREGAEEAVLRTAEKLYYEKNPQERLYVRLTWPSDTEVERSGPFPQHTMELAREVVRLVEEGKPRWKNGGEMRLESSDFHGTPLSGVLKRLSASKVAGADVIRRGSSWGRSTANVRKVAGIKDVERAVFRKEDALGQYKSRCDEAWLVVALTGGLSSFDNVEEAALRHTFESSFDRVTLLRLEGAVNGRAVTLITR